MKDIQIYDFYERNEKNRGENDRQNVLNVFNEKSSKGRKKKKKQEKKGKNTQQSIYIKKKKKKKKGVNCDSVCFLSKLKKRKNYALRYSFLTTKVSPNGKPMVLMMTFLSLYATCYFTCREADAHHDSKLFEIDCSILIKINV
jgi:hypothetical protein